ncbi:MAG: type I methionyl aminopeptidase [Candidatus Aminicenantes bacterium]|nr:type I methionyl aminopeptidase [Candidatus Aminicenantes bacterium]
MIIYKSSEEINKIKESNQIVGKVLSELKKMIEPGITTKELDEYAEKRALEEGSRPAFKGYRGYPASLCTSVNEEIVHGIPSSRKLKNGDIISLDFGVEYQGLYGDAAFTCQVGEVSEEAKQLIKVAEESFYRGFEAIKTGKRLSDVSHAIQVHVESFGFSVIRSFVGHGIGYSLHEDPQIPNFGAPGHGPVLKPGMVLAIEPMISMGDWQVEILGDDWTAITRDKSLSAHYEHTLAITENGPIILSQVEAEQLSAKETKELPNA